jgi:hypothetical protein
MDCNATSLPQPMPPSSSSGRTRLVLVALFAGCVIVGLTWGLRWAFEGRVLAGQLSPDDAMLALTRWTQILQGFGAAVAAVLAGLLLHLARATQRCLRWPPSGRWPAPRAVSEIEATMIVRRLRWAAGAVLLVAAGALMSALL